MGAERRTLGNLLLGSIAICDFQCVLCRRRYCHCVLVFVCMDTVEIRNETNYR